MREKIYPFITNINGTIYIKSQYLPEVKNNAILYIALYNDKGIIFGIKQIINPKFPLKFKITYKNILYPKLVSPKCTIKAILNYHGNLHEIKSGDIYSNELSIPIIKRNINIILENIKN
ncbi:MAG: hypothetical protein N2446_02665 [Elusimicrobiales bacterium]|nr:hypothetical protein [Elusimicrobiales bacterium]